LVSPGAGAIVLRLADRRFVEARQRQVCDRLLELGLNDDKIRGKRDQ
jgi:hypothetical protein